MIMVTVMIWIMLVILMMFCKYPVFHLSAPTERRLSVKVKTREYTLTDLFVCWCVYRWQRSRQPAVPSQLGLDLPGERLPVRQRDGGTAGGAPPASRIPRRDLLRLWVCLSSILCVQASVLVLEASSVLCVQASVLGLWACPLFCVFRPAFLVCERVLSLVYSDQRSWSVSILCLVYSGQRSWSVSVSSVLCVQASVFGLWACLLSCVFRPAFLVCDRVLCLVCSSRTSLVYESACRPSCVCSGQTFVVCECLKICAFRSDLGLWVCRLSYVLRKRASSFVSVWFVFHCVSYKCGLCFVVCQMCVVRVSLCVICVSLCLRCVRFGMERFHGGRTWINDELDLVVRAP